MRDSSLGRKGNNFHYVIPYYKMDFHYANNLINFLKNEWHTVRLFIDRKTGR